MRSAKARSKCGPMYSATRLNLIRTVVPSTNSLWTTSRKLMATTFPAPSTSDTPAGGVVPLV